MKSTSDDKTGRAMSVHKKPAPLPRPSRSYTVAAGSPTRRSPAYSTSGPRPNVKKEPIIVYFGDKTSTRIEIYATHSASAMKVIIFKAKKMPFGDIEKFGLYSEIVSNLQRKVSEVASDSKPFDLYKKYLNSTKSQLRFFLLEKSKFKDFKLNKFGKGLKKLKKAKKGKTMRKLRGISKVDRSESSRLSPKKKPETRRRSNTTGSLGMRESCPSTAERVSSPAHVTKDNEARGDTPTKNRPGSPTPARKTARDSGIMDSSKLYVSSICGNCSIIIQDTQNKERVVGAAKAIANETQKLIACAKHVSVLLLDFPLRQKQLLAHGRGIALTTSKLAMKSQRATTDSDFHALVSLAKVLSNHCEEILVVILSANTPPVPAISVEVELVEAPIIKRKSMATDPIRSRAHTTAAKSSLKSISKSNSFEQRSKHSIESSCKSHDSETKSSIETLEDSCDDVDKLLAQFETEIEHTKKLGIQVPSPDNDQGNNIHGKDSEHAYLSTDEVDGIYAMITELETLTDTDATTLETPNSDDFGEVKSEPISPPPNTQKSISVSAKTKVEVADKDFASEAEALEKLMDPNASNSARLSVLMNAVEQDLQRETEKTQALFGPVDEQAEMDENDAILAQFDALKIEEIDLDF